MKSQNTFVALIVPNDDKVWEPNEIWKILFEFPGLSMHRIRTLYSVTEAITIDNKKRSRRIWNVKRMAKEVFGSLPRKPERLLLLWSTEDAYFERISSYGKDQRISVHADQWQWPSRWEYIRSLIAEYGLRI